MFHPLVITIGVAPVISSSITKFNEVLEAFFILYILELFKSTILLYIAVVAEQELNIETLILVFAARPSVFFGNFCLDMSNINSVLSSKSNLYQSAPFCNLLVKPPVVANSYSNVPVVVTESI